MSCLEPTGYRYLVVIHSFDPDGPLSYPLDPDRSYHWFEPTEELVHVQENHDDQEVRRVGEDHKRLLLHVHVPKGCMTIHAWRPGAANGHGGRKNLVLENNLACK